MSGKKDQSSREAALRATTAARLEAIVEAAERAAAGVIDDAEAQARAYLSESMARADREAEAQVTALGELTGGLVEEAKALRRQAERLQAVLEEARERLAEAVPDRRAADQPERRAHLAAVVPIGESAPTESEAEPGRDAEAEHGGESQSWVEDSKAGDASPAGARLLATQMAVSGSSREEIGRKLRNGFGIEDTSPILDAILGPEAESDA
jgi:hypothetical protein